MVKKTKEKSNSKFVRNEFNRQLREDYGDDYEFDRWFKKGSSWQTYRMVYLNHKHHTKGIKFKNYLEFGVGSGTFTKMFIDNQNKFTLIDISDEMIKQARKNLGDRKNVKYVVADMANYRTKEKFDFVFGSRVLKYSNNKPKLIRNIYRVMKKGGVCVMTNQNADTIVQSLKKKLGLKQKEVLHSKDVSIEDYRKMFKEAGFRNIRFYPAVIKIKLGVFEINALNNALWKKYHEKEMTPFTKAISGSWLVKMKK